MKQNLYLLLLLLSFSFKLSAQTAIPLTLTSPTAINACSLNSFQGSFLGQGKKQHFKIGTSILYNGNTHEACGLLKGSQVVVDSIRNSNGTAISPYNIIADSGFWSGTIPKILTSDTITVFFHVDVDCAIIPTNVGVNSMQLVQEWVDSVSTFSLNGTGANTDTSTAIKYPQLVNLSPTSYQAAYKDTLNLKFIFLNAGNAPANMGFHFEPDASVLCGTADTIDCSYQIGKLGIVHPFFPANDIFITLSIGDTLIISQRVLPRSCLSVCSDSAKLRWFCAGAQSSGSQLCDSCVGSSDLIYVIQNAPAPELVITRVLPSLDSLANNDSSCINDLSAVREWKYKITTNGPGKLDSARIHFSSADPLAMNILSLIPFSSIQIDTFCNDCYVDTMYQLNPNSLCNTAIPDPLGFIDFIPHNFGGNDSIVFTFKTYRCVEDVDTLFTMPKYFNTWKFEGSYARGICGDSVSPVFLPTAFPVFNIVNHIGGYVQPFTFYAPFITDLSAVNEKAMPMDSLWGDSAVFSVEWNGYMYESINRSLFGCSNENAISCTPHGYLKAVITTQPGLGVGTHDLQLRYTDSLGNLVFIAPDYYYTNFTDTACIGGFLTCYFNLENAGVNQALQNGYFDFPLKSCCGGQNGGVPYSVKFYFLLNPTGDCTGLSFPGSGDTLPPTCLSDSCEWLPLSKIEDDIVVHCPGCITPGIVISNYNIRRTSYGLQDTNNDGLADTPATPIDENSLWFNDHRSQLSSHYASLGDRLEDRLLAYFSAGVIGTGSGSGYTYPQMITNGAILKHLQLSRLIPASHDTMQLHIDTLTIYIDTPDNTGLNSCLDCSEYGLSPAQYSTQRKLIISGPAIYNYVDTSITNYYLINLTSWDSLGNMVGNLHDGTQTVYSSSVYPLAGFFEQQRYRIKTSYSVCGNFKQNVYDLVTDLEDVRKESEIENKMWLTGYLKPANAFSVYNAQPANLGVLQDSGWAIPPDTAGTPIDSSFAGQYLFVCEDFGGKLYFFSQDVRNLTSLNEKKQDCIKQINIRTEARMGGNLLNVYPYEYRPSVLQPENYLVEVPSLYYIVSASARNTVNYNGTSLSSTPWIPLHLTDTIGQVQIPDSLFNRISCLLDTSETDTSWFYYGSRITIREINLDIQPLVCTDSLTIYETDTLVVIHANGNHTQCGAVNTCASQYADTTLTLPYGQQAFTTHPNDSITYVPNLNVTSQRICMEFTLSNLAVSGEQITYVPNYFLVVPDSNQIPYLSNWTLTTAGGLSIPMVDSVFQLDSIVDVGEITTYRLCADFIACPADSLDSLSLKLGWNCNNFPTKQQADSSCFIRFIQYHLKYEDAALIEYRIVATSDTLPYTICKPFKYTKCFKVASAGDVQPLSFEVDPPAPWLHILSVQAGRDSCPGDTTHIPLQASPGTYTYNITDSTLPALGYTDSVLHTKDCLCGTVTFQSECDTLGGFLPNIRLVGEKYCGDSLYIDVTTNYLAQWDGGSECHDCFEVQKTVNTDSIAAYDTLTYNIQICANNGDSAYVVIMELLPDSFHVTSVIPFSAIVPDTGCINLPVTGYFTQSGSCPATTNTVAVAFIGYDSLNHAAGIDTLYASVCLQVMPQCVDSTTLIFRDGDSSSYHGLGYAHRRIYIEGDFYITQDFTLTACEVYAAPGAHIIAARDVQLTLDTNTVIQGCGYMWQGITLLKDAIITVVDSSSIQDADIGIEMWDDTHAQLYYASIINSVTGVKVIGPQGGVFGGALIVDECRFGLFSSAFKPDYPGQPSHGYLPYAGIDLYDVNTGIGGGGTSMFFNMNKGISALRSKVEVQNCKFNYIRQDNTYLATKISNGSALAFDGHYHSTPSYLSLLPVNYPDTTIVNCYRGVYSNYGDLIVQSCILHNVRTGIECRGNKVLQSSIIQENTINASHTGIFMVNNAGSTSNIISANRIQVSGYNSGVGINVIEPNNHSSGHYQISHNSLIRVTDGFAGIQLLNVAKPQVNCNVIEIERGADIAKVTTGINIQNSASVSVTQNSVNGYTVSNTNRRGISSSLSTNGLIGCNLVDSTGIGFFFSGSNLFTNFRGNKMKYHLEGLHLDKTAVIDTQQHAGNQWLGNYTGWFGAVNLNAATQTDLFKSLFVVDPSLGSIFNPTFPTSTINPPYVDDGGWFNFQLGGTTYSCGNMSNCHDYELVDGEGSTSLLAMIALDSVLSVDYVEESQSIAQSVLYERLRRDTALASSNVVYQYFLNNEPVLYNLYEARVRMQESREVEDSLANLLLSLQDAMFQIEDTIRYLNHVNKLNRDTIIDTLHASLMIMRTSYVSLVNQLKTTKNALLAQAGFYNTQVTNPTDLPLINERVLNEVELAYEAGGIDSIQSRYDQLFEIANQCPNQGGMSVYRARYYIALFNDSIEYDDPAVCLTQGILRTGKNIEKKLTPCLQITPNPSKDIIEVIWTGPEIQQASLSIFGSDRKKVLEQRIDRNTISVNIASLTPGVYVVEGIVDGTPICTVKIVVIR